MRLSWSVLLASGRTIHTTQGAHDSRDEFRALALCRIEDEIKKDLRQDTSPAGYRFARWEHSGHPLRKFWTNGLGDIIETTGERYANRTKIVRSMVDENEARKILGLGMVYRA
jgi:hypothetical protein